MNNLNLFNRDNDTFNLSEQWDNLVSLTKNQLQEIARSLRVKCTGNKGELCDRIIEALDAFERRQNQIGGQNENKEAYFLEGTPLDKKQKSYCRCLLHVASQQPEWCLKEQAWRQTRNNRSCYNPYAVCTSSLGRRGNFECTKYYDLDNIPEEEVTSLTYMKNKSLDEIRRIAEEERDF
jgi:hypothetical protein